MMDPVLENTLSVAGSGMEAKQLLLVYHQEDLEKLMQLPGLVITLELRMLLEDRHFLLGAGRKLGFEIAALGLELTTKEVRPLPRLILCLPGKELKPYDNEFKAVPAIHWKSIFHVGLSGGFLRVV